MRCFKFHSVKQNNAARSHFNRIGHAPSLQTECVTQVFEAAGVTNAINAMTRSARVEIKNDLGFNSLSDTLSHGCFICRVLNAKSEALICDRVESTDSRSAHLFFFWNQYLINETEMTHRICTWLSQMTFFTERCMVYVIVSPIGGTLPAPPRSTLCTSLQNFSQHPFVLLSLYRFFVVVFLSLSFTSICWVQDAPDAVQPRISSTHFSSHRQLSFPLPTASVEFRLTRAQTSQINLAPALFLSCYYIPA